MFGDVNDGVMHTNGYGEIVAACWDDLPNHYSHVELDAFVVMPNHVHGIINLLHQADVGAGFKPAPTPRLRHGLPEIVRAFKTFSSRRINQNRKTQGVPIWQRNYYEQVIRNERDLDQIRSYIVHNPAKWPEDRDNPANFNLMPKCKKIC
jgi:REP element-mobilizing transposase RayT